MLDSASQPSNIKKAPRSEATGANFDPQYGLFTISATRCVFLPKCRIVGRIREGVLVLL